MRVIAGTAKGRRLTAPRGERTRPTADRVKEAMFSALQPDLPGARVIDCYAGSGALGIEALSRGSAAVVFIERASRVVQSLRQNLELTGFVDRATVVTRGVQTALRDGDVHGPFSIAVLDPPYAIDREELAEVLQALVAHLEPGARVFLELATRGEQPRWPSRLSQVRTRRYGDTTLYEAVATTAPETGD